MRRGTKRWWLGGVLGVVVLSVLAGCVKEYKQLVDIQMDAEVTPTFALPLLHDTIKAESIIQGINPSDDENEDALKVCVAGRDDAILGDYFKGDEWKDVVVLVAEQNTGKTVDFTNFKASASPVSVGMNEFNVSGELISLRPLNGKEMFESYFPSDSKFEFLIKDAQGNAVKLPNGSDLNFGFKAIQYEKSNKAEEIIPKVKTDGFTKGDNDVYYKAYKAESGFCFGAEDFAEEALAKCLNDNANEDKGQNLRLMNPVLTAKEDLSSLVGDYSIHSKVLIPLKGRFQSVRFEKYTGEIKWPSKQKLQQENSKLKNLKVDDSVYVHLVFYNGLPATIKIEKMGFSRIEKNGSPADDFLNADFKFEEVKLENSAWVPIKGDNTPVKEGSFWKFELSPNTEGSDILTGKKHGEGSSVVHYMLTIPLDDYSEFVEQAKTLYISGSVESQDFEDGKNVCFKATDELIVHMGVDLSVKYTLKRDGEESGK